MTQPDTQTGITLRVSVFDRCDLRCVYCLPPEGIRDIASRGEILTYEEIAQVAEAVARVSPSVAVRITGGEPLLRRDIERLVGMLSGLEVADLALTTSGQRLADLAATLRAAGLRRVNVSLDTLDSDRYERLTRGGSLGSALAGIDAAIQNHLTPVKLNAVALRGVNDDEICALVRYAAQRDCEMRFIELMPIGEATARHREWFMPSAEVRERLEREFSVEEELPGPVAPARRFRVRSRQSDLSGVVGFISPMSHPFCHGCRRLRLTSRGELLGCLMHGNGLDVRSILRNGAPDGELERAVRSALALKVAGHKAHRRAPMATIGG